MFIGEKQIQGYLQAGLNDILNQQPLADALYRSHLSEQDASSAVQWLRETVNQNKIQWNLGYPRTAPSLPAAILVIGSETETGQPIGAVGLGASGVGGTQWEGAWFNTTYRCLLIAANGSDLTYLSHALKFTLLRYREALVNDGLYEQQVSMTDILPAENYSDPNIEVFQRGVMLTGIHFAEYPVVQTKAILSMSEQFTYEETKESSPAVTDEVDTITVAV